MPVTSNTQETKLAYKVDARGLRDLRKEMGSLKDSLKGITAEQVKLTKALLGVEEGTSAYKDLAKQLDAVEGTAKRVRTALQSVAAATRDVKRGAFGQGVLQGLSPAVGQFIQRDEGMKSQFAGQALGAGMRGGVSRAGNAVGSMIGGTGPLTALLGNIPFIGGAAQAAEQQAGAAVAFNRTRMEALPFLGGFGARRGQSTKGTEGYYRDTGSFDASTLESGPGRQERIAAGARPDSVGSAFGAMGVFQRLTGAQSANEIFDESVAGQVARRRGREYVPGTKGSSTPGDLGPWMKSGSDAFLNRQQTMEAAGQFGRGAPGAGAGAFGQSEAARVLYGVDRGVSAGFYKQQGAGRGAGGVGGEGGLGRSIADALAQGLEGSNITDYLEQLVSLQERAASQGLKIDADALGGMARTLGGMGLAGPQGARVAGEFAGFGQRVGQTGAKGPMDMTLLKSLGFNPNAGGDSYIDALMSAEKVGKGGLNADSLFSMVSSLTQGGGSSKRAGFSLQRALGSAGVNLSLEQSQQMTESVRLGKEGFAQRLSAAGLGGMDSSGNFSFDQSKTDLSRELQAKDVQDWGAVVRSQIAVEDKLLAAGMEALPKIHLLQLAAADLSVAVAALTKTKVIDEVVHGVVELSGMIKQLVEMVASGGISIGRP